MYERHFKYPHCHDAGHEVCIVMADIVVPYIVMAYIAKKVYIVMAYKIWPYLRSVCIWHI